MGAPKQKWTSAEEAALKAGIAKYGLGKWSTILKDPEFSAILASRSNVDLKDKWRNINVMASGLGSRQRGKNANKSHLEITNEIEAVNTSPKKEYPEPLRIISHKKPITRLDNLILETLSNLKELRGTTRAAIAHYIEENYITPPDFERILVANLKLLTDTGILRKVKHLYMITPRASLMGQIQGRDDKNKIKLLIKEEIDAELEKMRGMNANEAAIVAAQAIAEAEVALAEAEQAAKEAEEAEAEAEAANCFVQATMKAFQFKGVN